MQTIAAWLAVNGVGPMAFLVGWAGARRGLRGAVAPAMLFLGLLVLRVLFYVRPALEGACFPYTLYARIEPILPYACALLGLGIVIRLAARHSMSRLLWGLAIVIPAAGLRATASAVTSPPGNEIRADPHHHCAQSTPFTCAPASCVAALSYLNIPATERSMARECMTSMAGTSQYHTFHGLSQALRGTGYRPRVAAAGAEALVRPGALAVVSVMREGRHHAVCVLGAGGCAVVQDPLSASAQIWPLETLRSRYAGIAVVIEPRPE